MSQTFLAAVKIRQLDQDRAIMLKIFEEKVRLARLKHEEVMSWVQEHRGHELGCWPLSDNADLCGIGTGLLAARALMEKKAPIKTLYVGIADIMIRDTAVQVNDDAAVVDYTYGNRTRLQTYLLAQLHQKMGRPGQHDHAFFVRERLEHNTFILKTFDLPDCIMQALEETLDCDAVVFIRHPQKAITVYPMPPPGDELLRMSWKQFMKSQSLHERLTNRKPQRDPYSPNPFIAAMWAHRDVAGRDDLHDNDGAQ